MEHTSDNVTHHRRVSLVGPVILIGAGIVFLLNNMGVLSWDVWLVLLRLWPILLIAIGLDLLIGRHSLLGSVLVVVLLLGTLGVALWFSSRGMTGPTISIAGPARTDQISQSLEDATRAAIVLRPSVADMRLSVGDEAAGLIEGEIVVGENERINQSYTKDGDTGTYTLASTANANWWPTGISEQEWSKRVWDLRLNPDVPVDLKINIGVGRTRLDLTGLNITNLNVDGGVGQAIVTLPNQGRLRATIDGGVGEVIINVPQGMAARIRADGGLGKVDVSGNYERQGEDYVSPNYETAENRVEVRVKGGIGSVVVR